jgi:hypothetical protein
MHKRTPPAVSLSKLRTFVCSKLDTFSGRPSWGTVLPGVAERYYIHVTETHVMTGRERFPNYHAGKLMDAAPKRTESVQFPHSDFGHVASLKISSRFFKYLRDLEC